MSAIRNKSNEDVSTSFTLDSSPVSSEEMPTITRLLNRKSLKLQSTYSAPPKAPLTIETPTEERSPVLEEVIHISPETPTKSEISILLETFHPSSVPEETIPSSEDAISLEPPAEATPTKVIRVQPARRRTDTSTWTPLHTWTRQELINLKTLPAEITREGLERGFEASCFLKLDQNSPQIPTPIFHTHAAIGKKELLQIWEGLKWDPKITPQVWNFIVKTGWVELSPPGTHTVVTSNRNVVRAAFGVQAHEWLTLIRVGSLTRCQGIIAAISTSSLASFVESQLTHWQTETKAP